MASFVIAVDNDDGAATIDNDDDDANEEDGDVDIQSVAAGWTASWPSAVAVDVVLCRMLCCS